MPRLKKQSYIIGVFFRQEHFSDKMMNQRRIRGGTYLLCHRHIFLQACNSALGRANALDGFPYTETA